MQDFYRPPYQVYTKYTKSDQLSTTKSDQNIVVDRFARFARSAPTNYIIQETNTIVVKPVFMG
jgi:hypothetical protein